MMRYSVIVVQHSKLLFAFATPKTPKDSAVDLLSPQNCMSQESFVEQSSGYTRIPSEDADIKPESVIAQPLLGEVPIEVGKLLPQSIAEEERDIDVDDDRIKDKGELTARAVIVGGLIGSLVAAMNVNFGLRTGTFFNWSYLIFF